VTVMSVLVWALAETDSWRRGEKSWDEALSREQELRGNDWKGSDGDYEKLLKAAEKAVWTDPDNVTYRHWLNVYRWHSVARQRDSKTRSVRVDQWTLGQTQKIVDQFKEGLWYCPVFGPTWTMMGQLEYFVLRQEAGARDIRIGYELYKSDATACYAAGLLAVRQSDWAAAVEPLWRAVNLDGNLLDSVRDLLLEQLHQPLVFVEACRGNMSHAMFATRVLRERPEYSKAFEAAHAETMRLMQERINGTDALAKDPMWHAHYLASMAELYRDDGKYNEAAEYYRKAIAIDPTNETWRQSQGNWRELLLDVEKKAANQR
jgi:tetratricopeptide (TPR) repeat protein